MKFKINITRKEGEDLEIVNAFTYDFSSNFFYWSWIIDDKNDREKTVYESIDNIKSVEIEEVE